MARREPALREAALTREKIVAESARVFRRRGYHGTRLADIARALGVTKAALYHYVGSKEEMAFQCHAMSLDTGMAVIRRARSEVSSPAEQLEAALARSIEAMFDPLRGPVGAPREGTLSPHHHALILERRSEYERSLARIIEEGIGAGAFVPCDARLVASAILGAVSALPEWQRAGEGQTPGEIARVVSAYLVRGLEKSPTLDTLPGHRG